MKQLPALVKRIYPFVLILVITSYVACITRSRSGNAFDFEARNSAAMPRINLNTASAQELEQLPGIGKVMAERIVAYREQNGRFRRREEVLMINGISEKKFEEIRSLIAVE